MLGAYISADINPQHVKAKILKEVKELADYLKKKKYHTSVFNTNLQQALMPKYAYQLKFTSLTKKDIDKSFTPLTALFKKVNGIRQFPNVVIYGCNSEQFLMNFKCMSDYVNNAKHGIINRLLDGHVFYKKMLLSMVHRAMRQKKPNPVNQTSEWFTCPIPEQTTELSNAGQEKKSTKTADGIDYRKPTWSTSWLDWIHETSLNVSIHKPTPLNPPNLTQTPIASYYDATLDGNNNFLDRLNNQLQQHNITYVEEIFNYYPTNNAPEASQQQKDYEVFLDWLTYMVPSEFHPFFARV